MARACLVERLGPNKSVARCCFGAGLGTLDFFFNICVTCTYIYIYIINKASGFCFMMSQCQCIVWITGTLITTQLSIPNLCSQKTEAM